jgi:hypothetical protein
MPTDPAAKFDVQNSKSIYMLAVLSTSETRIVAQCQNLSRYTCGGLSCVLKALSFVRICRIA